MTRDRLPVQNALTTAEVLVTLRDRTTSLVDLAANGLVVVIYLNPKTHGEDRIFRMDGYGHLSSPQTSLRDPEGEMQGDAMAAMHNKHLLLLRLIRRLFRSVNHRLALAGEGLLKNQLHRQADHLLPQQKG